MSTLVNYGGDEDFHAAAGSIFSNRRDSSIFLSLGPCVDVCYPPRKRSHIVAPIFLREERSEPKKNCSIDVLPDECFFEIFRRLPGDRERSMCACVSKRWLILQSCIWRSETCSSKPSSVSMKQVEQAGLNKTEEPSKINRPSPVAITEEISSTVGYDEQKSESDGFLSRCLEGKKATDIRLAAIAIGSCGRGGLGKLLIRGSNATRGVTNLGLSAIARGCPSLKVLSLWNVSSIGDEGLSEIANGCHMLKKLDLSQCPSISNKGIIAIAQNCPNLTELRIESCPNIGDESLQAIGRCCPNLTSVSIKDCPLVRDQGVVSLVSSASSVLTKIKLQAVNITDISLAVIGHYGLAVTDLVLTGLQHVGERGYWVMGNAVGLQKLKSITIVSCPGLTDLGLEAIGKGCPNLQHLNLRRSIISDNGLRAFTKSGAALESLQLEECNSISQSGVLGVLSNCEKLKSLALVKCTGIKDTALGLAPLSPCKSLRSLAIHNCPGFGSFGIAMVGELCPQVQHIDLSGLNAATDDGVIALLKSCKLGLVKVNLAGCINLSDAVVNAMVRFHGGTLRQLSLDGCSKITDESLMAIADNCLLLTDLDVSKCAVTDLGIAQLARAKHLNLKMLSLSGCLQVSDNCMAFLQDLGHSLVGLNLQHCNLITSRAAELLGVHLWKCDILSD